MAGYVCTIAGGKGGVGKTTTAVNVGAALHEMGHDVVVVDADLGMANLGAMLEIDHEESLHEILSGNASVSQALTDVDGGLTIIPGEQRLEAFADADPAELRKVIKTLRNAYDVVLIDTGAGLSHDVAVPLGLADGIVLVTTPDDVAVGDTVKTAQLADRIDGSVLGAVINRVTARTKVSEIDDRLDEPLLAVVPDDMEATAAEPLVIRAPDSNAADAYRRFSETLADLFFDAQAGVSDVDVVVDEAWFSEDVRVLQEPVEDDDEEDSGGVFGLFN